MPRTADPLHRDRILDAARRTFRRRGYNGAPMSEIARDAGIAVGTLYLYFESKDDIARAITAERFAAAVRVVLPALERPLSRARIRRMVYDTFDAVFADPAFGTPDLPLGDVASSLAPELYRQVTEAVAAAFARQMSNKTMQRYDAATIADYFIILLRRALLVSATTARRRRDPFASCLVDVLCRALLPAKEPARLRRAARR
jgi:AcrR family transcriptional regulator